MKLDIKKIVVLLLVIVAMAAYFLRSSGVLYIPGLTSGALAVGLGMLSVDMLSLKEDKKKKIIGVLLVAFAILMALTCITEIFSAIQGA